MVCDMVSWNAKKLRTCANSAFVNYICKARGNKLNMWFDHVCEVHLECVAGLSLGICSVILVTLFYSHLYLTIVHLRVHAIWQCPVGRAI